jgi:hypothetical protein
MRYNVVRLFIRLFGETYCLYHQFLDISQTRKCYLLAGSLTHISSLKMEAVWCSETSVNYWLNVITTQKIVWPALQRGLHYIAVRMEVCAKGERKLIADTTFALRGAATVCSFTVFKWIDVYKLGWNWRSTARVCQRHLARCGLEMRIPWARTHACQLYKEILWCVIKRKPYAALSVKQLALRICFHFSYTAQSF